MSAFSLFLALDGVAGESTARGHEGHVDLDTWAFGLSSTVSGGGGGGAGRALWDQIILTMPTTAALPQLMALCAQGRTVRRGVLTAQSDGGDAPFVWLRLTLDAVRVTHVASGASASGDSSEDQVGLSFGAILVEKYSQAPDGTVGAPVSFGWDLQSGRRTRDAGTANSENKVKATKAAKPAKAAKAAKASKAAPADVPETAE